jgi:signal transduction histidine kinase
MADADPPLRVIEGSGLECEPAHPLVMVVDDDETGLMLAEAILKEGGFRVATYTEANSALRDYTLLQPDLVMMDVVMPGLTGYDACAELRQLPGGANLPVVMMTSLDDPVSIDRAYDAGATDFTAKPVNWPVEVRRVRYLLGAARAVQELMEREEDLRQAQKMEAVGRLAGGVAHDFNNLLTTILGFCSLAEESAATQHGVTDSVHEIRRAAERAADLSRQVLAFSRKQTMQPGVVVVGAVVEATEKMLRRLLSEDIELLTEIGDDGVEVFADPVQLQQAILNLVVNACDAMPEGGRLTIATARADAGNGTLPDWFLTESEHGVVLEVRDTGVGMDAETKARVFEPFFTTKDQGKGTGLGLSTVYDIVTQSRGSIHIESERGIGTSMKIFLPESDAGPCLPDQPETMLDRVHGTETILLVEDETSVRNMIARSMERRGYTVLQAKDATEALALAAQDQTIDVLVTDLVMPGIGGKDLADALAELYPTLRQIFISGYHPNTLSGEYLRLRHAAFLQKPFPVDQLNRLIRRLMDEDVAPAPFQGASDRPSDL